MNAAPTTLCPNCGRALPPAESAAYCPSCGHPLRKPATLTAGEWNAWGWMLFWVVLLAPAAVTFAFVNNTSINEDVFLTRQLIACAISAVVCGGWAAYRITKRPALRIFLGILLVFPFWLLAFFICFLGCVLGLKK